MAKENGALAVPQIESKLRRLRGWSYNKSGRVIERTYVFPSFPAAVRFVDFVAELAEAADHHPDLDIRYNQVRVAVSTHSAGGITTKDFALAAAIDQR